MLGLAAGIGSHRCGLQAASPLDRKTPHGAVLRNGDGPMKYYERLLNPRKGTYLTVEDFLRAVVEYFEWCENNPLLEEKIFQNKGDIIRGQVDKLRPFTKQGLASFLGMPVARFDLYRERGDAWADAVEQVEQIIYTQKFEGAAANLLNASLIQRDLGLADKTVVTATTVNHHEITDADDAKEAADAYRATLENNG